jgi:hypothetical protein
MAAHPPALAIFYEARVSQAHGPGGWISRSFF